MTNLEYIRTCTTAELVGLLCMELKTDCSRCVAREYPQGYNNRPCDGWQLVCKANKKVVTDSGYSVFGMRLTNA